MFYFIIFLNDENHTQIVSPGKKKLIQLHVLKQEWLEAAFCCTYICVYLKERCLLVSNHAYLFVLVRSPWISPTKNFIKVLWCHAKEFLYSNLSSNLSSCTSISYKHRLILLPSQGFTHTDVFLFFLFFFNK